jgi:hypothetical protein
MSQPSKQGQPARKSPLKKDALSNQQVGAGGHKSDQQQGQSDQPRREDNQQR